MRNNLYTFIRSLLAGICIAIGCNVYLSCDNKYFGSILFSVGLISILYMGFNLFTGKIGYIQQVGLINIIVILIGNIVGCFIIGTLYYSEKAEILFEQKLQLCTSDIIINSVMCGLIMYMAVSMYNSNNNIIPVIMCVSVFILSGYEHSIADITYCIMGRTFTLQSIYFLTIVVIGNTIGGMIIPLCNTIINKTK